MDTSHPQTIFSVCDVVKATPQTSQLLLENGS